MYVEQLGEGGGGNTVSQVAIISIVCWYANELMTIISSLKS